MHLPLCKSEWPSFITMAPLRYRTLLFSNWLWPSGRPELTRQHLTSAPAASWTIWQPSNSNIWEKISWKEESEMWPRPETCSCKWDSSKVSIIFIGPAFWRGRVLGPRGLISTLLPPVCRPNGGKYKQVESGGSLGYGKPQIFTFKILNVFTNSKCVH